MCAIFKIALDKSPEIFNKLKQRYGEDEARKYLDTTLFPKADAPVLGPEKKVAVMNWGFPVSSKKSVVFNARSETLEEKPLFKTCVKNYCKIPASAFYEWGSDGNKKEKYIITLKETETVFFFAGLWKKFLDKDGNKMFCFTILTTSPNSEMAKIHSRMPVILNNGSEDSWLESGNISKDLTLPFKGEINIQKAV